MKRILLQLFLLPFMIGSAAAQEPRTENTLTGGQGFTPNPTKIEAMSWLAGRWVGTAMGGSVEETWSPPDHGEMIGMFRCIKDGKVSFYEFMTISETNGGLVLRIKHFDANLKGWEAQDKFVEFGFVAQRDSKMCFEGLTFAPEGDDRLTIFVADENDGKYREIKFEFTRGPSVATDSTK